MENVLLEGMFKIAFIPITAIIVYVILAIYKKLIGEKTGTSRKIIPVMALLLGLLLSFFTYTVFPEIIPTTTMLSTAVVGMVSGGCATCLYEITHLFEKDETPKTSIKEEVETKE